MTHANNASLANTSAILLAGGRGARLGGADKGWVLWRERPLVLQVLERLQPQVATVVLSCNRNLARYQDLGLRCVTDHPGNSQNTEFAGPLAGISAACGLLETDWVLLCPCDTPLIPADLAARLHQAALANNYTVTIAAQQGRQHYAHALLSREFAATAQARLQQGDGSLQRWFATAHCGTVEFPTDASFRNINTAEDLIG